MRRLRDPAGQALVEVVGALPALLALGLVIAQLLAVGYAAVLAGNAAEAGALALAGGGDARERARAALPGWSRGRSEIALAPDRVRVRLTPPSLIPSAGRVLRVTGRAEVTRP